MKWKRGKRDRKAPINHPSEPNSSELIHPRDSEAWEVQDSRDDVTGSYPERSRGWERLASGCEAPVTLAYL